MDTVFSCMYCLLNLHQICLKLIRKKLSKGRAIAIFQAISKHDCLKDSWQQHFREIYVLFTLPTNALGETI